MAFCDRIEYYIIVKRELAEWFIAISLKLILVKYTNIRSNRIFSDENTILLQEPWRFASFYSTKNLCFFLVNI